MAKIEAIIASLMSLAKVMKCGKSIAHIVVEF
jgi:hypothetical protein